MLSYDYEIDIGSPGFRVKTRQFKWFIQQLRSRTTLSIVIAHQLGLFNKIIGFFEFHLTNGLSFVYFTSLLGFEPQSPRL